MRKAFVTPVSVKSYHPQRESNQQPPAAPVAKPTREVVTKQPVVEQQGGGVLKSSYTEDRREHPNLIESDEVLPDVPPRMKKQQGRYQAAIVEPRQLPSPIPHHRRTTPEHVSLFRQVSSSVQVAPSTD